MKLMVIARIRVQAGKEVRFEQIFATRRARCLREEPATLRYDLLREEAAPLVYTVIEEFAGPEGLRAHLDNSTDHTLLMACFDGKPETHTLTPCFDHDFGLAATPPHP